jgi:hypothetical protein
MVFVLTVQSLLLEDFSDERMAHSNFSLRLPTASRANSEFLRRDKRRSRRFRGATLGEIRVCDMPESCNFHSWWRGRQLKRIIAARI